MTKIKRNNIVRSLMIILSIVLLIILFQVDLDIIIEKLKYFFNIK